ncbi:centromere-associated protein E-like isoform X1 [Plodia interpunctella]|uniref:centromere-associated protein E-like isoform X1 n=1 Tax=Plodia interpunctella TaxID=58824 RepID=UPI002368D6AA|nr:centromere-associated protein E-like isoform X1 [Plodia interpunctella]
MSDNIKVVVKVRPLISREIDRKAVNQWRVKNNSLYQVDENGKDVGPCYSFDKVYGVETKTSDVFKDVAKPIVEAATAGFNGTIFAYGQTSSGKTYTMSGTEDSPGIIPLAVQNLYEIIKNIPDRDFLVRVSYIEIYNETLKDLLDEEKKNVKVFETLEGEVKVDAKEHVTTSPEEMLRYLKEGEANRQTGSTNMNEISSRSHSIFQITIESREHIEGEEEAAGCVNVSQLNLVDLAGSERAGHATGLRFKEGTHINKSLSALALVIKQLSEDPNKFANYRDSKLTRILQNSLGGNAKTSIICAVTPAAVEETISTLQFANRAKAIKNKPEVNAVATDATMIQGLTKQLSQLQSQLETKRNLEVMLESKMNVEVNLKNQIAALQKLILNGFGQRSSAEIVGSRRKNAQLRRVTISTLHSIEEDPVPDVPKFCTPSLKYNSMLMPGARDFVPIQDESKLSSVPEEPRLITPPPNERRVNFKDEVIDLALSKTPPCVLRRKAKIAEKDLKDIVELTNREKIYMPAVEELMKKLEHNTSVISKLEEDVISLSESSKEKDLEIDKLKLKIIKSEEEMKAVTSAKEDMETLCKDYTTKLTDWEVSYETLKQKTQRREQELLSLLDEHQKVHNRTDDIGGKTLSRTIDKELSHFMDMSRDISLVNSDNESSIANTNDDECNSQIQDMVSEMQTQLTMKTRRIIDLESNLFENNQKIESLELACKELQEMLNRFQEKLGQSEDENHLLKATIDTLNSTINNQKSILEATHADIDSYNSLIQELQIKLRQKESMIDVNIDDSILENMIQNEEKVIANNENIKNIINSFKIVLDSRNKEIDTLKLNQSEKSETIFSQEINKKEKQINSLCDEVQQLQDQITENIAVINSLKSEKKILLESEHQLTEKLHALEEMQHIMEQKNNENSNLLVRLQATNDELAQTVCDQNEKKHALVNLNAHKEELQKRIYDLERDIEEKNVLIESLKKDDSELQETMNKAKEAILKLQKILADLTGNIQEVPEVIDNFVVVIDILDSNISKLESTIVGVIDEKKAETEISKQLRDELALLKDKYEQNTKDLLSHIDSLNSQSSDYAQQNDNLQKLLTQVSQELDTSRNQLSIANEQYNDLHNKSHEHSKQISAKDDIIISLQEKLSSFNEDICNLQQQKQQIDNVILCKNSLIEDLEIKLKGVEISLEEKSAEFVQMTREFNDSRIKTDRLLQEVLEKTNKLTNTCNLQTNLLHLSTDNDNKYNQITSALDSLSLYLSAIKTDSISEHDNLNKYLAEAKQEIVSLSQQNVTIKENVSLLQIKNQTLIAELEEMRTNYNNLQRDLKQGNELIESLQSELKNKLIEIEDNKSKVLELKEKVGFLDMSTKQKIEALQIENERLKSKCQSLETISFRQSNIDNSDYEDEECNSKRKSLCNVTESNECKPPSLVTICCKRLEECIQPTDRSLTSSNSETSVISIDKATQTIICHCERLLSDLTTTNQYNEELKDKILQLLNEREEVRKEIQLLLEPANELQKRIVNHRTNLSTLTATTYAENKSLKSQVTALQHHHTRFHMLCQRDIPAVKKQLSELMTILKKESSFMDKGNISFKRFSLPDTLENNTTISSFKNDEITLDGDLLMLDTNVTLATSADNTLMGHDQTCLDISQAFVYNEVACQTNDVTDRSELFAIDSQIEILSGDNIKMNQKLESLKEENIKLREQVDKYTKLKEVKLDVQLNNTNFNCQRCEKYAHEEKEFHNNHKSLNEKLITLDQELADLKMEKDMIENKYQNLLLDIPSTDALVRKLNILEKEKNTEIGKLMQTINFKSEEIKRLQEENDTLSTQVMENIDEADDLNKQLQILTNSKTELMKKCSELEKIIEESKLVSNHPCRYCKKNDLGGSVVIDDTSELHSKYNRSLSESDTSSRFNKICTLQNQLYASKQDCKELSEDVTTIKNHLDRGNISIGQNIDLDDSMGESNVYTFSRDFHGAMSLNMPNIPEEHVNDMYMIDRKDCINYYLEVTGTDKENLSGDLKIIDVMKLFYSNFVTKHNNEVENLINKLKCYEESRKELEFHVDNLKTEYSRITDQFNEKDKNFQAVANILTQIKDSMSIVREEIIKFTDGGNNTVAVVTFKENLLKVIDSGLGLSSANVFEKLIDSIVRKHENDLSDIMNRYVKLQEHMEIVTSELDIVNNSLMQMKSQLTDKENEYNLLKAQKERVHEISNAVTLDIVKKERELSETIRKGCQKLVESDIISVEDIDWSMPLNNNINVLFDRFVNQYRLKSSDSENLISEINKSTTLLQTKEKELESLKVQNEQLHDITKKLKIDLEDRAIFMEKHKILYDDLSKRYESKEQENEHNVSLVAKMSNDLEVLKGEIQIKQDTIDNMTTELIRHMQNNVKEDGKIEDLMNKITMLEKDMFDLKTVNEIIKKEKEATAAELSKCEGIIKINKSELEKMTSDILVLRESVKDNITVIDSLKVETKSLLDQNMQLKQQFEEKCRELLRLETNIKTHEKTAEIQSKMIIRLQKQKEECDNNIKEKHAVIEELTAKCTALQKESEEIDLLKSGKKLLETRISELENELEGLKRHTPNENIMEASRRRRQSLYDSQRAFAENKFDAGDHTKIEAVFESRTKPDDLFMDVDEDSSNRSTPLRLSKGRDSLLSRIDQNEKEKEDESRPSSVQETRRRRQSTHDLHRSVRHTPSPRTSLLPELEQSELSSLRTRLAACQEELEELKERYKELDDECETCAQYLRERDAQCAALKREKAVLEKVIAELRDKSMNPNQSSLDSKKTFVDAFVNTDEDWANLHSVVVDRMSYDAEVEKNKRLAKLIEELRMKKQELKNTVAKMQKLLEKNSGKDNRRVILYIYLYT